MIYGHVLYASVHFCFPPVAEVKSEQPLPTEGSTEESKLKTTDENDIVVIEEKKQV